MLLLGHTYRSHGHNAIMTREKNSMLNLVATATTSAIARRTTATTTATERSSCCSYRIAIVITATATIPFTATIATGWFGMVLIQIQIYHKQKS